MKNWFVGVLGVVGAFLIGIGVAIKAFIKGKAAMSVSIIGGADGPTSVFVAGKIGRGTPWALIGGGAVILVLAACLWGFLRSRKGR